MEFTRLSLLALFCLALVGIDASQSGEDYWKSVWPSTALPKTLSDLLLPYSEINVPIRAEEEKQYWTVFFEHDLYPGKKMSLGIHKDSDIQHFDSKEGVPIKKTGQPLGGRTWRTLEKTSQPFRMRTWGQKKDSEEEAHPFGARTWGTLEKTSQPFGMRTWGQKKDGGEEAHPFGARKWGTLEKTSQPFGMRTWGQKKDAKEEAHPFGARTWGTLDKTSQPFGMRTWGQKKDGEEEAHPFGARTWGTLEKTSQPFGMRTWGQKKDGEEEAHPFRARTWGTLEKTSQPFGMRTWGQKKDGEEEAHPFRARTWGTLEKTSQPFGMRTWGQKKDDLADFCENPSAIGEEKYCALSLESMMDFAISKLGTNIKVISSSFVKNQDQYVVEEVKKIGGKAVMCHRLNFKKVVFYCHQVNATTAYMVPLVASDGTKAKALTICHHDTRGMNPDVLYNVLKVKPGTVPVCHFVGNKVVAWVPNDDVNDSHDHPCVI